ncbi:hypothetical protein ACHAXT_010496 [Thalassiosira profunda]
MAAIGRTAAPLARRRAASTYSCAPVARVAASVSDRGEFATPSRRLHVTRTRRTVHPTRQFSSLPAPSNNSSLPEPQEDPHAHLAPIDFATASHISGEESQILEVRLQPNQMLRAESGAMLYMTHGVQMETSMGLGGKGGGSSGLSAGFTRMMTGQNLMVSDFSFAPTDASKDQHGTVGLGTDFPAKILRFDLAQYPEGKLICQKGAFLAGSHSVAMEMAYTKTFTSGFFGGEGFILQSLQGTVGEGEAAFLKAYGTVVKRELKEGETLRVSSGSLVCMTSTIDYNVQTMPGFKNVMFGGEGLFVTTLTGPGTVWLQGMPVDRMVSEIARKVPGGGIGLGIPIGLGGGGGEGAGDAADAGDAAVAGAGEEAGDTDAGVSVSEAAVDADRNATVASSGMSSDPESSESLFGDAAYGGESAPESDPASFADEDASSSSTEGYSQPEDNTKMPEFEEPTINEQQFEDDGTTFSTYEGGDSPGGEGMELPTPDDEGPGLLGQLWDIFKDFTDE